MDAYQVDADALFSSDESDHGHDSNANDRASDGTTTTRAEATPVPAPAKRQRVSNDYSEGRSLGGLRLSSLGRFSGAVENLRRAEPTRRPTVEGAHIYNKNQNNNNSRNNNNNRFNRGSGFGGGMGGAGSGPRGNYGGHFRGGGRGRGRGNSGGGGGGGGMRDSYIASGYGGGPGRGRGRPLPAHMTRGRGINGDAPRPAPPPKLSAAEKAASIIPEGERQRVIGALEANRAANANSAPRRRPGRRMPARRADNASGNSSGGDVSSASANAAVNVNNSLSGKRRGLTEMLASVRDVDDLIKLDPDRGRRGQGSVGASSSMVSSSRGPPKSEDDRRKVRRSVDLRDVYANAAISKEARMKEAAKQEAERRAVREKFEVERRREREERRAFAHRLRKLPTVSESMRVATKMAKAERDLFWDADKSERDQLGLTGIHLREFAELHPRTEELLAVEIVHI